MTPSQAHSLIERYLGMRNNHLILASLAEDTAREVAVELDIECETELAKAAFICAELAIKKADLKSRAH